MKLLDGSRNVFYFRNRTFILIASPPILLLCFGRILTGLRSGSSWVNWLAVLVVWLHLLFLALCRRLVFTQDGLEYTEFFTSIHVPWAQVTRLVSRKLFGIWHVEGLEVWTLPGPKDRFIDLTQFDRSWRSAPLGSVLEQKVPHLFQHHTSTQHAP